MSEAKPLLLVVDDDEMNRDMLGRRLERAGFDVTLAEDGPSALTALDRVQPDLILLDIMMPGMSGLEVLRRIRAAPGGHRAQVILVTARAQSEDIVEGLEAGADDYVTKPIDMPVALARIRTQLAKRKAELALSESEERYALAVQGTNDGVWDWNLPTGRVYYSPRWKAIMGYGEDETPDTIESWLLRVHDDDLERVRLELDEHLRGQTAHLETQHRTRRGDSYRWVLVRGLAIRDGAGKAVRVAGSLTDITEGKVADALTGLPNRILFNDRLSRLFEHARRAPGFQYAVLFLDLDRFKTVNDSLGHRAGDALLVQTARRLERNLRSTDSVTRLEAGDTVGAKVSGHTVARFGGDEFAIILSGIRHVADATRVADRLNAALAERYEIEGQHIYVTASIGIALSMTGYDRPEDMLRDADTALYRAKAAGRGRYELFDAAMREQVVRRLELETDLRQAIERQEFVLFYQPIVALPEGELRGAEALIRWMHPTRGTVMPNEFLPLAEETGVIVQIGHWVLGEACRQIKRWEAEGQWPVPCISVNVSARQLAAPDFVARVTETVAAHGVSPQSVEFEITESIMMADPDAARGVLQRLKSAGFRIAIDDFGTGYSSLSYLQRFPVDRLKLDRSFLAQSARREESSAVMESVITLARHLRLEVVAEGIETPAQMEQVRGLKCGFGQGFYIAYPAPPGEPPWTPEGAPAAPATPAASSPAP
ncbi:MAG: hypothetical protein H6Q10_975 [Acidobacteria bacterium]|nr:hypothetical protein [Acidobacteriota bacterium]